MEATLLRLCRMNYFDCKHGSSEGFTQWWLRKQELKAQCDLDKPMTLEEMEMLELIRRIGNDIFCLKILEGH